jgi:phosphopantothenoylcysteine decarboxylase/phosphopantothenate--cysteine ligase
MALAQEAVRRGARVTLILGPVNGPLPRGRRKIRVVPVVSAREMDAKVQQHLPGTQVFVGAAAVSDYRPVTNLLQKLKRKKAVVHLKLVRNPDIIAKVARRSQGRPALVVGFALETRDLIRRARTKLRRKGLDWIVANRESNLGSSRGAVTILSRWHDRITIRRLPKEQLAVKIWETLLSHTT